MLGQTGAVGAFFKAELSDWFIHIIEHETHHVRSSLNVEYVPLINLVSLWLTVL